MEKEVVGYSLFMIFPNIFGLKQIFYSVHNFIIKESEFSWLVVSNAFHAILRSCDWRLSFQHGFFTQMSHSSELLHMAWAFVA